MLGLVASSTVFSIATSSEDIFDINFNDMTTEENVQFLKNCQVAVCTLMNILVFTWLRESVRLLLVS